MPPPPALTVGRKCCELFRARVIGHSCKPCSIEPVKSFFASLTATPFSKQSWSSNPLLSSPGLGQGKKEACQHPQTVDVPRSSPFLLKISSFAVPIECAVRKHGVHLDRQAKQVVLPFPALGYCETSATPSY